MWITNRTLPLANAGGDRAIRIITNRCTCIAYIDFTQLTFHMQQVSRARWRRSGSGESSEMGEERESLQENQNLDLLVRRTQANTPNKYAHFLCSPARTAMDSATCSTTILQAAQMTALFAKTLCSQLSHENDYFTFSLHPCMIYRSCMI